MPPWRLKWERGAVTMLRALPWREGQRVDAAVLRFAESGVGCVDVIPGDPRGFRLRVPPYVVRLEADTEARMLRIFAVFKDG